MSHTFETEFGGRTLTIETGKLARLAGGAVTVRYGDTLVLGTANRSDPRPGYVPSGEAAADTQRSWWYCT